MRPVEPPNHLLDASTLQLLDQRFFSDRLAILHAGFVTGAPAEPLESLPLFQQREGEAIGEVVW
jgi:hypothetical protein